MSWISLVSLFSFFHKNVGYFQVPFRGLGMKLVLTSIPGIPMYHFLFEACV
jgi:hypothetical protein